MDRELIRTWLELPPGSWPPDHYTLLALEPGETDVARIEQQVHERMQRLRSYQLTHPELATEAMNRLAQALVCLTDPDTKKAYDRGLFSKQPVEGDSSPRPASVAPPSAPEGGSADLLNGPSQPREAGSQEAVAPATEDPKFFDWQTAPPPLRQPPAVTWPAALDVLSRETTENSPFADLGAVDTTPDAAPAPPAESAALPAGEELVARFSRLGLRSKGALYYHIARMRQLLWAWEQAGKYLNHPTRLLTRPAEATDLIHHMQVIRELLQTSTPLLGEAGQPGYLVLALARQQLIVPTLQTLLPSQREALARDWQAGHALLLSLRQFLRQELRHVRRRSSWRHGLRLIGAALRDHPGTVLLLLAWVTVNLASPHVRARWPEQLVCLLALAGIKLALWLYSFPPLRIPPAPRSQREERLSRKRPGARRQPHSSRA